MDNASTLDADLAKTKLNDAQRAHYLSKRGQSNHDTFQPILASFGDMISNTFDPKTNPSGIINAGIAENSLNHRMIEDYYAKLQIEFTDLTYGDDIGCSQRLKKAYADFINDRIKPTHKVTADSVFVGAGVGAVIDSLVYAMCDPGDGVLVAEPYYNGFDVDFSVRAGAIPVGVKLDHLDSPFSNKALEAFETTYLAKKKEGIVCKAVMLCNPHNPLGRCYPRSTILEYIRFCQKYDLWLISDEIYAFSIFDTPELTASADEEGAFAPFHSILTFTNEELNGFDKVCFLHGMSKDFCANGFRMGLCVIKDTPLRVPLSANGFIGKISSLTDIAFSKILLDRPFLDTFLAGNRQKLAEAYAIFAAFAEQHGLQFASSHAGHFVVLDLRPYLERGRAWAKGSGFKVDKQDGWADEAALQEMLMTRHQLFVSAGAVYHFGEPGFFRWTFTMRSDYATVAMNRLAEGLGLVAS